MTETKPASTAQAGTTQEADELIKETTIAPTVDMDALILKYLRGEAAKFKIAAAYAIFEVDDNFVPIKCLALGFDESSVIAFAQITPGPRRMSVKTVLVLTDGTNAFLLSPSQLPVLDGVKVFDLIQNKAAEYLTQAQVLALGRGPSTIPKFVPQSQPAPQG